jgi:uroporphyrinogen III methyltransferase/synthase
MSAMSDKGKVYLVGAGPGRIDLITVRGLELLKTADCVIYDKLANAALLRYARPDAELIAVPKRIGEESFTQEQINSLLIEKAAQGKIVVRLKGGDPFIFGRGTEEAKALAEADVDFEVVPGVTAATAASAYAGIALTDRNVSSQVVFVTGREAEDKKQSSIDWKALARFRGTLVFYMAMQNLDFIVGGLTQKGLSPDTPVAVIADATLPTQKIVKGRVKSISTRCRQAKVAPPAIVVVGPTAKGDNRLNWISKTPLFGKIIAVTRDAARNAEFAAKIAAKMALPVEMPVTKLKSLADSNAVIKVLTGIGAYNWIIFTSPTGVELFFGILAKLNKDPRVFGSARIAAIGGETSAALNRFGLKADFVPSSFTSRDLAKGLIESAALRGRKILLLRSQLASGELPQLLQAAGAAIDDVPIYTHEKHLCDLKPLSALLAGKALHWLTFASPFAARCFFEQVPGDFVKSSSAKVASIGPITSMKLAEFGVKVDIEAAQHTIDGLLAAIERYEMRPARDE